ncbi:MAG: hypothetical protein AAFO29_09080, partial [Actinomycetota bacterium]
MTTLVPSEAGREPSGRAGGAPSLATRHHDGVLFAWLLAGYPVAWVLGLGLIHHLVLAGAMALWLMANRPLRIAPGTGALGLFVVV